MKTYSQKLVFVSPGSIPGNTGDVTHNIELVKKFAQKGLEVFLVCHWHHEGQVFDEKMRKLGIRVIRVPFIPPGLEDSANKSLFSNFLRLSCYYLVECVTVSWLLSREQIRERVIVRCVPKTLPLSIVIRLLRIDSMAEVTELPMGSYIPNLGTAGKGLLLKMGPMALRSYRKFRVMANEQRDYLVKLGISSDRIIVLPAGVNIQEMPKPTSFGSIPPATFGFFGNLEAWQGVDTLVKSFSIVVKAYPNSKLYIVGDGSLKNSLVELAKELRISDNVIILHSVPRDILWNEYFPKFRSVVIPRPKSVSSSLVPMKLIESFAAGKIVITTPIDSIKHILKSCAIMVPFSDTNGIANGMLKVISDENLQTRLSENSMEAAKLFDIGNVAQGILEKF